MVYAIAFGGLLGTVLLAYAIFGAEFMFPRWKRWALGFIGFGLASAMWVVHPVIWNSAGDDGYESADWP